MVVRRIKKWEDTAAGNSKVLTVPKHDAYRIQGAYLIITATATVGTRIPTIIFRDESNNIFARVTSTTISFAASGSASIALVPLGRVETTVGTLHHLPIPDIIVPDGWDIVVEDVNNIDASDTFSVRGIIEELGVPDED